VTGRSVLRETMLRVAESPTASSIGAPRGDAPARTSASTGSRCVAPRSEAPTRAWLTHVRQLHVRDGRAGRHPYLRGGVPQHAEGAPRATPAPPSPPLPPSLPKHCLRLCPRPRRQRPHHCCTRPPLPAPPLPPCHPAALPPCRPAACFERHVWTRPCARSERTPRTSTSSSSTPRSTWSTSVCGALRTCTAARQKGARLGGAAACCPTTAAWDARLRAWAAPRTPRGVPRGLFGRSGIPWRHCQRGATVSVGHCQRGPLSAWASGAN
jgi:hypothetical protein